MSNDSGSFKKLVSGLSDSERKSLLEKMKSVHIEQEAENLEPVETTETAPASLAVQIKSLSIFFRFWLWLKAAFTNSSMEVLYNEYRIKYIARMVERVTPGMVDAKRSYLMAPFFDAINELKESADFFRLYIDSMDENVGEYYILLGSIVMPEVEAQFDSDVDPYSLPLTSDARPESRMALLRKMEAILQDMPADAKTKMYVACRASSWLMQFVRLPFARLLSHFNTVVNGEYHCAFTPVESDLIVLSKVLSETMTIPDEVLEALYLFSGRLLSNGVAGGLTSEEDSAGRFMEKARSFLAAIRRFLHTVPICSITRIVCNDSQWAPESFTGGEDWFVIYKAGLKKLFERKWDSFVIDCKKESLKEGLAKNFKLQEFPLLPVRPWAELWGGLPFRYELTAGFLFWYFRECFPSYELTLKTIMLEGDFVRKENRVEYTEAFNDLIQVSIVLASFNRKMHDNGEMGLVFRRLINEKTRTLQGQAKADDLLRCASEEISSVIYKFGESCRRLELVLNGILQTEAVDSRYDSLHNLVDIQGSNNANFRNHLLEAKCSLKNAHDLVKELEPLDTPKMFGK